MRRTGQWLQWLALVLGCAPAYAPDARAQQIYSCPQPGAPPRYQDRPCAATPAAAPQAKPADAAALRVTPSPAATPTRPAAAKQENETRAEYVARNAQRCDAGDRRACVAVTCERSGGLGTRDCQAALGYRRGAGWDLRPASDVFDPRRRDDEYTLRCTRQPQRARVSVPRDGTEARVFVGAEATKMPLAGLTEFAVRYCAAP